MFIAIPKSVIKKCPPESLPARIFSAEYVLAQSKGQARRAIGQVECEWSDYEIFELKETK